MLSLAGYVCFCWLAVARKKIKSCVYDPDSLFSIRVVNIIKSLKNTGHYCYDPKISGCFFQPIEIVVTYRQLKTVYNARSMVGFPGIDISSAWIEKTFFWAVGCVRGGFT